MARPRILPDAPELSKLRREGKTYQDIATMYGVTRAAVHVALERSHLIEKPRPRYQGAIPWEVKAEHSSKWPIVQLRRHARREAGGTLTDRETRFLDNWLAKLAEADAVVGYHPDHGFYYTARRPEDGEGLVRKPDWMIAQERGAKRAAPRTRKSS